MLQTPGRGRAGPGLAMTTIRFRYVPVGTWPPLAWLAHCVTGREDVDVFHGPRVETTGEWFGEVVWDGDYAAGGFDQTDVVFGSGGRVRERRVALVSGAATVDRLQCLLTPDAAWVSNSLPCLLAATGATLDPTYPRYFDDFESITSGLVRHCRSLRTSRGPVGLVYYHNLTWTGHELLRQPKPVVPRDFTTFERYRAFLDRSLERLSTNGGTSDRRYPYRLLGTLSSGYDSPTVTVLARPHGLTQALSFDAGHAGAQDEDPGRRHGAGGGAGGAVRPAFGVARVASGGAEFQAEPCGRRCWRHGLERFEHAGAPSQGADRCAL